MANTNISTTISKKRDVSDKNLTAYDSLYKVEFNFADLNIDIEDMDVNVLSKYIVKVLENHPYYVDVSHIVKIDIDKESKMIIALVSEKEVEERLLEISENKVKLESVIEDAANSFKHTDKEKEDLEWVNSIYPDKKYLLEYKTPEGKSELYEYNFKGFDLAKNLYHEKAVIMNDKKRNFLRNDDGTPYYYDEYTNTEIEYNNDKSIINNNSYNINPKNSNNVKMNLYDKLVLDNKSNVKMNVSETTKVLKESETETETETHTETDTETDTEPESNFNKELDNHLEREIQNNRNKETDNKSSNWINYLIITVILVLIFVLIIVLFNYLYKSNNNEPSMIYNLWNDIKNMFSKTETNNLKVNRPNNLKVNRPNNLKVNRPNNLKVNSPNNLKVNSPNNLKVNRPNNLKVNRPNNLKVNRPNNLKVNRPNNLKVNRPNNLKVNS